MFKPTLSKPLPSLLATAALLLSLSAAAGVQEGVVKVGLNSDNAKDSAAAVKDGKASAGKQQATAARSGLLLRCWNYGKLVYEAPAGGFVTASAGSSNVVTVPGTQQKQILDMRGGLCVIE